MEEQTQLLQAILAELKALHASIKSNQPAPRLEFHLDDLPNFPWDAIGAVPAQRDKHGISQIWWGGRQFFRRSPDNRYTEAIFFSRSLGKEENGKPQYEWLIRFSTTTKPLTPKGVERLRSQFQSPSNPQSRPQPQQGKPGKGTISREQWLARQQRQQGNAG